MPNLPSFSLVSRRTLPVYIQAEANECGIACLAMLLTYWGRRTTVRELSRSANISPRGTSVRTIARIAEVNGLQQRTIKASLEELEHVALPAILHWDMNHYVVLKRLTKEHAFIHDPAIGEVRVSISGLSEKFTGIVLEFAPVAQFEMKEATDEWSVSKIIASVANLRSRLGHLFAISILIQAIGLTSPYYIQWVLDDVLAGSDRELMNTLGIGFIAITAVQLCFGVCGAWLTVRLSNELSFQWGSSFVNKLFELPMQYFDRRHLADISSRFSSLAVIQRMLTTQVVEGFLDIIIVVGASAAMLMYRPSLFAVSCVSIALYAIAKFVMYKHFRIASSDQITCKAKEQAHLFESIRGIQSLKIFGRESARRDAWVNFLVDEVNADLQISRLGLFISNFSAAVFSIERIAIIWICAFLALDGKFTAGMMIAFLGYRELLAGRVASFIDKIFDFRLIQVHVERIRDVLDHPSDTVQHTPLLASAIQEEKGASETPIIEFKGVSYRHSESEPYILRGISFKIDRGECAVVTGPSGSGKSTLIKLLVGLYPPTEGEIFFKGKLLSAATIPGLRDILGVVMQDDLLFSGTVAENISFGDGQTDVERMVAAASEAMIHKEICEMPMGYNTLVGDGGVGLSGGQRQRILIARALYRNPSLLVFDEATSQLDPWNEKLISRVLEKKGITRIIVAHKSDAKSRAMKLLEVTLDGMVRELVPNQIAA